MFERAREIVGSSVAADVAIDAGSVNVERAGDVFSYAVVSVGHLLNQAAITKLFSERYAEPTTQQSPPASRQLAMVEGGSGPGHSAFAL